MRILLDTCTFLWIAGEPSRLSKVAREAFADPDNDVYLSAASAWEIALKASLGKLELPRPAWRFVPEQRRMHGIEELAVDEEAVLQIGRLPRIHNDPFDRLLAAQSIRHGLTILTPDVDLAGYPVRTEW